MNSERGVVFGVVGLVLATTLVSGPLVAAIDFTTEPERPQLGQGNATVGDVSVPRSAEIAKGRYGSGSYYLRVPDATIELENVSGTPLVEYEISIEEMGYSRSTTHFLSASSAGTYALTLARDSLEPAKVERESYRGTVTVTLRSDGTERLLASRRIDVEVIE